VREALAKADLHIVQFDEVATRTEKGEPVPGLLVVASAPPSSAARSYDDSFVKKANAR
jgi:hypothetical protein